mmetsp:Transcript_25467/g.64139  ORF Transcript_25467/g.64139 Transcript_25467/m.64139 type:complete len:226 (-) Transcript_25467:397-1074(-)
MSHSWSKGGGHSLCVGLTPSRSKRTHAPFNPSDIRGMILGSVCGVRAPPTFSDRVKATTMILLMFCTLFHFCPEDEPPKHRGGAQHPRRDRPAVTTSHRQPAYRNGCPLQQSRGCAPSQIYHIGSPAHRLHIVFFALKKASKYAKVQNPPTRKCVAKVFKMCKKCAAKKKNVRKMCGRCAAQFSKMCPAHHTGEQRRAICASVRGRFTTNCAQTPNEANPPQGPK